MKKLLLSLSLALCVGAVSAQEVEVIEISSGLVNKKGMQILPQAGDFAIGVDAEPFLKYAGNMLSDAVTDGPTFGDGLTIYGKYFLANDRAIRAKLLLNLNKDTQKEWIVDQAAVIANPDSEDMVDDIFKRGTTEIKLNVGYEWRRGYGRLQGFYGAELQLGFESNSKKYEYGNDFSVKNPAPYFTDFGDNIYGAGRVTEYKSGLIFGLGVGAFAGVEYFVAPKIALGGEVGLSLAFTTNPKGKLTHESWDAAKEVVKTEDVESYDNNPGNFNFSTKSLTPTGKIYVLFHF